MIKMVCLILGGGAGTRLSPLTSQRSKPAVPIGGKYRLIDIPISNCINSGVKRMFVLTQFNSASLNQHIKNTYHFDIFHPGFIDILAAEQTPGNPQWYQGTADAVRQSMHHLSNHDFDYILILSGDQLYQMDFDAFAQHHIDNKAEVSIATTAVVAIEATEFGIMKVDKNRQINTFIEKPKADVLDKWKSVVSDENQKLDKHFLANMGIYIFNKQTMQELFAANPTANDFGKEIIPAAILGNRKVVSYEYNGYWTDIGNIKSFFEANIELTSPLPKFNLFDSRRKIFTHPRLLPPSKIFGTTLNEALLADGCIVHAKLIEKSIIGIRSRIGLGSIIKECYVMGHDYYQTIEQILDPLESNLGIGENCHIERAILDKNCRIGNNVKIKGGDSLPNQDANSYSIVDGIVVIKKGAVITDGTQIGEKVI
jgi:glucose-1-phosphate adenylyltransferase